MSITMYEIAVPSFTKHLEALDAILDKAQAYTEAKKIDPDALLMARLYPDMYTFKKQVQSACDFAKLSVGRLAGLTPPVHDDSEKTFADLKKRIAETLAVLASAKAEPMEAAADREVKIKAGPRELTFTGREYLLHFALPNFYFHCATAYGILRHNGLEIGKRDFMRRMPPA
ncbi:DUF1993 domain-containing protein [Hyphomicrobium sp.]|uniref:DUF1993 domain-containing protein n=1 Tax=Hyphomicrobium sp. TaxID=82 RepID=UPI002E30ED7C|nr:DUF1993 domain-containing protein [Hyphomicrobium sp.]HEX2842749.1 DUF1993 domain-containing protein [Hyphomicrobium sp.]